MTFIWFDIFVFAFMMSTQFMSHFPRMHLDMNLFTQRSKIMELLRVEHAWCGCHSRIKWIAADGSELYQNC